MKRIQTLCTAFFIAGSLQAQIALDVKTIDLSANGKTKKARFVSAKKANGELKMTFSTRTCEQHDLGDVIEFEGTKYNFEHLVFDEQLQFKRLEEESVVGMGKALAIAPVLGSGVDVKDGYGYWQGAGREGSWLDQYRYYPKIYASVGSKFNPSGCMERLEAKKTGMKIPFTGEGFLYSCPLGNDITTLTYTAENGVERAKVYCRIYGTDGAKRKETTFDIPYKNFAARFLKVQRTDGVYDHIMILQPTSGWNKYGVKVAETKTNPLEFEYFRIDGTTLEVKERFSFNALNTQWLPEQIVEHNGSLYILGQSSGKVKMTGYYYGSFQTSEGGNFQSATRIDELENYQIVRIQNGKMAGISVITPDDMEKVQQNVSGKKGNNSPSGYFRFQELKIVNNNLYITGQNTSPGKVGDDRKEEFMMILNANLKPEHVYFVAKSNYANSNMFVSGDAKTMYWAIYDYSNHEVTATRKDPTQVKAGFVLAGNDHAFTGKSKNDDGPSLELVKIDLSNNTAATLQKCGEDDYTLLDECPVLYTTDKEVVFLGVSGGKNERVSKLITLKL